MGFMTKKYSVSASFCYKTGISSRKPKALWILSQNLEKIKTCKNICIRPLCITDPEYELHGQETQSFDQFLAQIAGFR
jgi:hypothetical protein